MAGDQLQHDAAPGQDSGAALALTEDRIATVVSAAWELELVIAGGVTFALFQLPTSLDSARYWMEARATSVPAVVTGMGFVYAKLMVYVLLGAFLLNLTARAYWVGLVGLHSVFPRGIDWGKQRIGPAARDVYRERLSSLPAIIGRVDNFASIIFSFAFLIVILVLMSVTGAAVFGGLAWTVNTLVFKGRGGSVSFLTIGAVFIIPLIALGLTDKYLGPRWPADSVAGRRLRAVTRVAARINGTDTFGPIFLTLLTNLRSGVMLTLFYGVFVGGMLIALGEFFVHVGIVATGTPRYIPDDEQVGGVVADYYESLRASDAPSDVPTIQSDVVDGPYVRLFIPYLVERHEPALASRCPGVRPQRAATIHFRRPPDDLVAATRGADSVLACLARLHALTLDGVPRPELSLRFYTHPVTGRRGMIAYLATAPLASGAHTLSVMPPPRAPTSQNRRPLRPFVITFQR